MAKRLAAKVGEYTNKQGETKGRYVNLGAILDGQNGEYLLLDPSVNLAGVLMQQRIANPQKAGEKVLVSIFTDEPKQQAATPKPELDDSIPF